MSYSRDERLALSALLAETGPDAPTLCAGWTTGDRPCFDADVLDAVLGLRPAAAHD